LPLHPLKGDIQDQQEHHDLKGRGAEFLDACGDGLKLMAEDPSQGDEGAGPEQRAQRIEKQKTPNRRLEDAGEGWGSGIESGHEFGDQQSAHPLIGEGQFRLANAGIRFEGYPAEKVQDLHAFTAPELVPNEVRAYGGDHRDQQRKRDAHVSRAGKCSRSQQHGNGRDRQSRLLQDDPEKEDGIPVLGYELQGVHELDWIRKEYGRVQSFRKPCSTGTICGMRLTLFVAIVLMTLPVAAHDLYLVTEGTGAQQKVCARIGEHFPASMNALPANRANIFQARSVAGKKATKLTGVVEEAAKEFCAPLATGGNDLVEMTVNPVFIRLAAKDFNGYIEGEGFKAVIAARKEKGATQAEGRELYSRYTKLLLPTGTGATEALGHALEIVPEVSPSEVKAGEMLPVRVLFMGKPLAGVRVSAVYAGAKLEGHAYPVNAETDAQGRAHLKLDRGGLWYARLIHMVPAENDPEVDWRSFFATMTFTVPEKR
jgi:uncharacterized GH25 family protein